MAKQFDPSQLSPADQAAFAQWQQRLQQYVAQNGGGVPAPVSYALAHPEYLQQHPELQGDYELVSGAMLPPSTREQLKGFHPVWSGGNAGMQKDRGLFGNWETWLQLALGGAVGGLGASAALAGTAAPAAATTTGGATAAGTGTAAGATSAYGPLAGGYGLATTEAAVPASLAAEGTAGGAAAAGGGFWDKVLGKSKADKILTGVGLAGNLAGNLYQGHQIDKATQAQVDAAQKALELQGNIYQQQRADLAPYRGIGSGAVNLLNLGMGITPGADTTTPFFQQQTQAQNNAVPQNAQRNPNSPATQPIPAGNYTGGQAVPRSSLAGLGGPAPSDGMVAMISPDGRQARVPQNQVQAAQAAGGRLA